MQLTISDLKSHLKYKHRGEPVVSLILFYTFKSNERMNNIMDMTLYRDKLTWGCELEMTGRTRLEVTQVIATHFGTSYTHEGGGYDKYLIPSPMGTWTVARDSSIIPLKKRGSQIVGADDYYKVEVVTPVLKGGKAIDGFQEVIRKVAKSGAFASDTCGCHVHVGIDGMKVQTIINILNQIHSKQNILFHALGIKSSDQRYRYCAAIPTSLVETIKKKKPKTLSELADIWYGILDPYGDRNARYNGSRYRIVNLSRGLLHNRWYLGTCEFRCFSTPPRLHCGMLRSYISFCLLLVQYANSVKRSSYKVTEVSAEESEKYKLRCFLLKLGAISDEFKTLRLFWLERFGNQSSAWRRGQRM